MSDTLWRLRLARAPGIGPRGARALEEVVGLERLFGREAIPGVPARVLGAIRCEQVAREAARERSLLDELGYELLTLGGAGYPGDLASIHDPPQVLSAWGELTPEDQPAVAIVGARRATHEGRDLAYQIASELAEAGVTVVSGLARGIDSAAHRGALDAGGRTLAVLGCGLRRLEPHQEELAARVASSGALLSEYHPDEHAQRHTFPQRNRIIVGLSLAVVVVQAGPRSGALISADLALSEGRELFAVPGSPREPLSRGPNGLIRDGARLVESGQDVLDVVLGVAKPALR